ncbi:hypothetical protein ACMFMG_011964 [Clarireedia jacksonii]
MTSSSSSLSSAQQLAQLITKGGTITESEAATIFDSLPPTKPSLLIGSWEGRSLDTGHPGHQKLTSLRWAGKEFRGVDDADPIVVYDAAGQRVVQEDWGHASLREMVFRGVTSAAMIYDNKPIFDHFRYATEDLVMGAMDCPKVMGDAGTYYFCLTRRVA